MSRSSRIAKCFIVLFMGLLSIQSVGSEDQSFLQNWRIRLRQPMPPEQRIIWEAQGIRFLQFFPPDSYLVRGTESSLASLGADPIVAKRTPLTAQDKISAGLLTQSAAKQSDRTALSECNIAILFAPDTLFEKACDILQAHGAVLEATRTRFDFRTLMESIAIPADQLVNLAAEESVLSIAPAVPAYMPLNLNAQDTSNIEAVRSGGLAGLNLDGNGVAVGLWESGQVLSSHEQLLGRVFPKECTLAIDPHSTHVAGTIAASGSGSAAAEGIAPRATLQSWDFNNDLYEMDMHASRLPVSNHSYASRGVTADGRPSSLTLMQVYSFRSWGFDAIASDWDLLVVTSAGNNRNRDEAPPLEYRTVSDLAESKNSLSLGAVMDLTADPFTFGVSNAWPYTSWGPTLDGRLKPELVANGYRLMSTTASGNREYMEMSGTSMAAPVASGAAALLVQQYRNLFHEADPPAALLKGILLHTAKDDDTWPGPDYHFGYGLLDAQAATEFLRNHHKNGDWFHLDSFTGRPLRVTVQSDGKQPIKATLTWMDPAAATYYESLIEGNRRLINDLDIKLIGPQGEHYPWTLDPAHPDRPAQSVQPNRVDPVEQVALLAPAPGEYTLEIGGQVRLGRSQRFALCVSGAARQEAEPRIMALDRFSDDLQFARGIFHITASDAAGISKLTLYLDGEIYDRPDTLPIDGDFYYSDTPREVLEILSLDLGSIDRGSHTLEFIAENINGETASWFRMIEFQKPPEEVPLMADASPLKNRLRHFSTNWHIFQPVKSATYTLEVHPLSEEESLDPVLILYDAAQLSKALASDDDSGIDAYPKLTSYLSAGKTYKISVNEYNNRTGDYAIDVKTGGLGQFPSPRLLARNGAPLQSQIEDIGDVHWYAIRTEGFGQYDLSLQPGLDNVDSDILRYHLFRADNRVTPIGKGTAPVQSALILPENQTYWLKVYAASKSEPTYSLELRSKAGGALTPLVMGNRVQFPSEEESKDYWFTYNDRGGGYLQLEKNEAIFTGGYEVEIYQAQSKLFDVPLTQLNRIGLLNQNLLYNISPRQLLFRVIAGERENLSVRLVSYTFGKTPVQFRHVINAPNGFHPGLPIEVTIKPIQPDGFRLQNYIVKDDLPSGWNTYSDNLSIAIEDGAVEYSHTIGNPDLTYVIIPEREARGAYTIRGEAEYSFPGYPKQNLIFTDTITITPIETAVDAWVRHE